MTSLRGDWVRVVAARPDSPSASYGPGPSPGMATRHAHAQQHFPSPPNPLSYSEVARVSSSPAIAIAQHSGSAPRLDERRPIVPDGHPNPRQRQYSPHYQPSPAFALNSASYIDPSMPRLEYAHSQRPLYSHPSPHSYESFGDRSALPSPERDMQDGKYLLLALLPS